MEAITNRDSDTRLRPTLLDFLWFVTKIGSSRTSITLRYSPNGQIGALIMHNGFSALNLVAGLVEDNTFERLFLRELSCHCETVSVYDGSTFCVYFHKHHATITPTLSSIDSINQRKQVIDGLTYRWDRHPKSESLRWNHIQIENITCLSSSALSNTSDRLQNFYVACLSMRAFYYTKTDIDGPPKEWKLDFGDWSYLCHSLPGSHLVDINLKQQVSVRQRSITIAAKTRAANACQIEVDLSNWICFSIEFSPSIAALSDNGRYDCVDETSAYQCIATIATDDSNNPIAGNNGQIFNRNDVVKSSSCLLNIYAPWAFSLTNCDSNVAITLQNSRWNEEICSLLPDLLASMLIWHSAYHHSSNRIAKLLQLFPPMQLKRAPVAVEIMRTVEAIPVSSPDQFDAVGSSNNYSLVSNFYGREINMSPLWDYMREHPVVPVLWFLQVDHKYSREFDFFANELGPSMQSVHVSDIKNAFEAELTQNYQVFYHYITAQRCVWLPKELTCAFHPVVLCEWFGKFSFIEITDDDPNTMQCHPLWDCVPKLSKRYLHGCLNRFNAIATLHESYYSTLPFTGCLLAAKILSCLSDCLTKFQLTRNGNPNTWPDCDELCNGMLPRLIDWPIFPSRGLQMDCGSIDGLESDSREMRYLPASELVWIDFDEYFAIPKSIRQLLDPFLRSSLDTFINNQKTQFISTNRDYRTPMIAFLHDNFIRYLDESSPRQSASEEGLKDRGGDQLFFHQAHSCKLQRCMQAIACAVPDQVVPIHLCVNTYLLHLYEANILLVENSLVVNSIIELFYWAAKFNHPEAINYVLVEKEDLGEKRSSYGAQTERARKLCLLPIEQVVVGSPYDTENGIESVWLALSKRIVLPKVSSIYADKLSLAPQLTIKAICNILKLCGAQYEIAMTATYRTATNADAHLFPTQQLPKLRSSSPSTKLQLPYDLGYINRKEIYVVDLDISSNWKRVFALASTDSRLAAALARQVSRLFRESSEEEKCIREFEQLDIEPIATPSSTPAAAAALKGKSKDDPNEVAEFKKASIRWWAIDSSRAKGVVLSSSPYPIAQRAYYLPPGQPGASAVSLALSPASWLQFLASTAWVPARPSLHFPELCTHMPLLILPPSQVLLPEQTATIAAAGGDGYDRPVATLASEDTRRCARAPQFVLDLFDWGHGGIAVSIDQFDQVITRLNEANLSPKLRDEFAKELMFLWISLMYQSKRDLLSDDDKHRIRDICGRQNGSVMCVPFGTECVVPISKCIFCTLPASQCVEGNLDDMAKITANALCKIGYVWNIGNFVINEINIVHRFHVSADVAQFVASLFPTAQESVPIEVVCQFISDCSSLYPSATATEAIEWAYYCSLWMVIQSISCKSFDVILDVKDVVDFASQSKATKALTADARECLIHEIRRLFPKLRILCNAVNQWNCVGALSHSSHGSTALRRWVHLFHETAQTKTTTSAAYEPSGSIVLAVLPVDEYALILLTSAVSDGVVSNVITIDCCHNSQIDVDRQFQFGPNAVECLQQIKADIVSPMHRLKFAVLSMLQVDQLSDPNKFSMTITAEGHPIPMNVEGTCINLIVKLLLVSRMLHPTANEDRSKLRDSALHACRDKSKTPIQLFKMKRLVCSTTYPGKQTFMRNICASFARHIDVEGIAMLDSSIAVCGSSKDYLSELHQLVSVHCIALLTGCSALEARLWLGTFAWNTMDVSILLLLQFIEHPKDLICVVSRQFGFIVSLSEQECSNPVHGRNGSCISGSECLDDCGPLLSSLLIDFYVTFCRISVVASASPSLALNDCTQESGRWDTERGTNSNNPIQLKKRSLEFSDTPGLTSDFLRSKMLCGHKHKISHMNNVTGPERMDATSSKSTSATSSATTLSNTELDAVLCYPSENGQFIKRASSSSDFQPIAECDHSEDGISILNQSKAVQSSSESRPVTELSSRIEEIFDRADMSLVAMNTITMAINHIQTKKLIRGQLAAVVHEDFEELQLLLKQLKSLFTACEGAVGVVSNLIWINAELSESIKRSLYICFSILAKA